MSEETITQMSQEDCLKAVLYQFVTLYERWAEDRQVAAKQGADMAELVKGFMEQVKQFKELEPQVRKHLVSSVSQAVTIATEKINAEVTASATKATGKIVQELSQAVQGAQQTLRAYQVELKKNQWQVIGVAAVMTVATSLLLALLLVKFVLPEPIEVLPPLSRAQIGDLRDAQIVKQLWPNLTKKEQAHWRALVNEIEHPQVDKDTTDSSDNNI